MRAAVIVPASNEAALIGGCLSALVASEWPGPDGVEVIVVANGCTDDTAERARDHAGAFAAKEWRLTVLELAEGGKLGALNAGDAAVSAPVRIYLDADVTVGPGVIRQVVEALEVDAPRYASGRVEIAAEGAVSRAYARIWRQVPFMAAGVPGCGLFAVNAAGRARWGAFPDIISDDTFVRLNFTPEERVRVDAAYRWPIAEGFSRLVRVRRRQDAGVEEIGRMYPQLLRNEDKAPLGTGAKLRMALRDPLGFGVYSGVALAVKATRGRQSGWSRGR
jgi:glycosyltransferase involved in cell wall biosynthesis